MKRNAQQILSLARCELIVDHPFFGQLVLMLASTPVKQPMLGPTATDGKRLFYSPEAIEKFNIDEVMGLIAHEACHLGFGHTNGHRYNRTGNRDPIKWNVACDLIINEILKGSGLTLPNGTLDYKEFKFIKPLTKHISRYTAEELYSLIPDQPKGPDMCGLLDPITGDDDRQKGEGGSGSKSMSEMEKQLWTAKLKAAAQAAKRAGTLPAGIEELIEELRKPKHNWIEELAHFIQRVAEDYTWNPPDRRMEAINQILQQEDGIEILLPSMNEGDRIADLIIAVDTSGSISQDQLVDFLSETYAIGQVGMNLHLVYCDAAIQYWGEFNPYDLPLTPKGRGGTDFRPVFNEIEKRGIQPEGVVFFSDGYLNMWPDVPRYPVVWVINNQEAQIPWGQVIHYEASNE